MENPVIIYEHCIKGTRAGNILQKWVLHPSNRFSRGTGFCTHFDRTIPWIRPRWHVERKAGKLRSRPHVEVGPFQSLVWPEDGILDFRESQLDKGNASRAVADPRRYMIVYLPGGEVPAGSPSLSIHVIDTWVPTRHARQDISYMTLLGCKTLRSRWRSFPPGVH